MEPKRRYLFICNYGQSRSKWFAEKFMRLGKMALFCGINDQADFELKSKHLDWADIIIILTNDITAIYSRHIDLYTNNSDRYRLNFYIDDRPEQFKTKFKELKQILIQKQLW